jgi:hypothetical protein
MDCITHKNLLVVLGLVFTTVFGCSKKEESPPTEAGVAGIEVAVGDPGRPMPATVEWTPARKTERIGTSPETGESGDASRSTQWPSRNSYGAANYGLEIQVNPEGIFRPMVPNPTFSHRGSAYRRPTHPTHRSSPARARIRIFNRGKQTITTLVLSVHNNYPGLMPSTVRIDALRGMGTLRPGGSVEVMADWKILPNIRMSGGAARIKVSVDRIEVR